MLVDYGENPKEIYHIRKSLCPCLELRSLNTFVLWYFPFESKSLWYMVWWRVKSEQNTPATSKTPALGSHPHNAPKGNKTKILTTSPPQSTLQSGLTHHAGRDKQLQIQHYKKEIQFSSLFYHLSSYKTI